MIFIPLLLILIPVYLYYLKPQKTSCDLKADSILVEKSLRKMTLFRKDSILKVYKIALGKNPLGNKIRHGDGKTPEGNYTIDWRNPNSKFFLSLHISYPDLHDKSRAAKKGVDPGGDIMIHGLMKWISWIGPLHRFLDWTDGCIAVTNAEMEEIWNMAPNGITIEIIP